MNFIFVFYLVIHSIGLSQTLADKKRPVSGQENYIAYHRTIAQAQKRIAYQDYQGALTLYKQVFDSYRFVFLKDLKVATQLAV